MSENSHTEKLTGGSVPLWFVPYLKFESSSSSTDDNPRGGHMAESTGKISVNLPSEDWLCRKLVKLTLTVVEG